MKSLLRLLKFLFSNDINIKIYIDLLLDNFEDNYITFLFFLSLDGDSKRGLQAINNVLILFFFKYVLSEISLLRPVFEFFKILFFAFMVVALNDYLKQEKREVKNDDYIQYVY